MSYIRVYLFLAFFSACIIVDLLLPSSHTGTSFHDFDFFNNIKDNFIFTLFVYIVVAFVLSNVLNYFFFKFVAKKTHPNQIGEILIAQGHITEEQLHEALLEQKLRMGELLVKKGRLTVSQRDEALEIQKKKHRKIGEILRELGHSTHEDISWALQKMNRQIGSILIDMNLITDYDISCALTLKECHLDPDGRIDL
jgi:hypothetical protein